MEALTFIRGIGPAAIKYGLEESIFLDAIVYWSKTNKSRKENYRDGRWWTYNSVRGFAEMFPWWSEKQIRRIANSCVEKGALVTGNYNKNGRDRTIWYSPSDELLALYGEDWSDAPICPNGQMHSPKRADASAQMGEPLPCNKPCNNIPPISPKGDVDLDMLFERFWAAYPKQVAKPKAKKEWKKLKPSIEQCRAMSDALIRQKKSEQWCKEGGKYIPKPENWLKDRRWEDNINPPKAESNPQPDEPAGPRRLIEREEVPDW